MTRPAKPKPSSSFVPLVDALCALYKAAATDLPKDVTLAMQQALRKEKPGSLGHSNLSLLLENIALAKQKAVPMCQDTGSMNFYLTLPNGMDPAMVRKAIIDSTRAATAQNILRPNTVDSVTGRNTGDNIGEGSPHIEFHSFVDADKPLVVDLLLKGGGCENVSRQYALPFRPIGAMRDLDGVKKCVLHCVTEAVGFGCPPAVLGIAIGGTRDTGFAEAKKLLMRKLTDVSRDKALAALESEIVVEANKLGIGTSGLGGNVTLLSAKACSLSRIPASFFVTISYDCWALRRKRLVFDMRTGEYRVVETYEE